MSLILCPECSNKISDKANCCPNCGLPLTAEKKLELKIQVDNDDIIELAAEYETMDYPNYEYAFELYQIAADNGSSEAQYHIGRLYKWGDGVDKSLSEAKKWFEIALSNGCLDAQKELDDLDNNNSNISNFVPVNQVIEKKDEEENFIPKCPTCGSPNIKKIGGFNKLASVALVGLYSAGYITKTFKCNNCNSKW